MVQASCTVPPNVPYVPGTGSGPVAETVGNGSDFSSTVSGTISWAEGSFPIVKGVTSVIDGSANNFSLQLNSDFFSGSPACSGGAGGCLGWEQFLYAPGFVFIQYWILNYTNTCPAGWNTFGSHCWKNSTGSAAIGTQPATILDHLILTGSAGSSDTVMMSTGNGNLYAYRQSSVLGLNSHWRTAEFNIVGNGNGSAATFNAGSTVVVQTVTDSVVATTSAPTCSSSGFTGETNSLSLVSGSCCPVGGAAPGIQFTQSNVAGATAQPCPSNLQSAAVCGRGSGGINCALSNGTSFGAASIWQTSFSDANGWNTAPYYSTIQFADINNDGLEDVCGRGGGGINCALSSGTSFGAASIWQSSFSDVNGWTGVQYYSTVRLADINGDGKVDVCGRGGGGINCALSNGTSFGAASVWQSSFSDGNGWASAQYYSTIQFPDINGDGKADVCGRGGGGINCALSNGTSFGAASIWQSSFSDGNGWGAAQYYSTIRFADLNSDGRFDVCGRGGGGINCALSSGTSFGAASLWQTSFSDANGWNTAPYYSTLRIVDVNGDSKADVCGRGGGGINCALSNGTSFGAASIWQSSFRDANGWASAQYYSTLHFPDE